MAIESIQNFGLATTFVALSIALLNNGYKYLSVILKNRKNREEFTVEERVIKLENNFSVFSSETRKNFADFDVLKQKQEGIHISLQSKISEINTSIFQMQHYADKTSDRMDQNYKNLDSKIDNLIGILLKRGEK